MANPRKFSEKIALHTQKQAEETAAFEAILQEVNSATRDPPRYQKQQQQHQQPQQHQHIAPNLGTYRGGSLPNVNQIAANQVIDLQATLQHDIKQGRNNLVERVHGRQDRHRQIGAQRRIDSSPYGSAYHLSPPPDSSWRSSGLPKMQRYLYSGVSLSRVHSDPSLHMNAMGNNTNKNFSHPPVTPPSHRRIVEMVGENSGDSLPLNYWDSKKMGGPSRPKSCEVPNINIYPSHEQDGQQAASPTLIPMTANNTGSLPDLSVLQFPSPLVTPLDQEDPYNTGSGTQNPASLSPTSPRHMASNMGQQSPNQRRRQPQGMTLPSPLVLNAMAGPPSPAGMADMDPCMRQQYMLCLQQQQQQQQLQQQQQSPPLAMRHRGGSHSPHSQPYPSPPMYSPTHRSINHHRQTTKPALHTHPNPHIASPTGSPVHTPPGTQSQPPHFSPPHQRHHLSQQPQQQTANQQQQQQQSSMSPPVPQVHVTNCDDHHPQQQQGSMTQYRNNSVSETNCQSPTSPHSYSPSQSPVLVPSSQAPNSTFTDTYYIQQQQQQTNALQHQFEQFNMNHQDPGSIGSQVLNSNGLGLAITSSASNNMAFTSSASNNMAFTSSANNSMGFSQSGLALQYSQAAMLGLTSSDELFQPHFLGPIDVMASGQSDTQSIYVCNSQRPNQQNSVSSPNSSSKIPDIVLTGADDMCRLPLDFAKDLGNAITGMPDCFDADFLANDEAFKAGLDPLDLEEIQMLTDASLVADPATEDSFKLDRL